MTPIIAVDTLVEFIRPVVSEFELQTNKGTKKEPQVLAGWLPEKVAADKQQVPDYPHVIVRFSESDSGNEENVNVNLIAGTYSEDPQNGWRDSVNVLTRIKQALMETQTIGAFLIDQPIHIELPEEQPYPQWVAIMSIKLKCPAVQWAGGALKDVYE